VGVKRAAQAVLGTPRPALPADAEWHGARRAPVTASYLLPASCSLLTLTTMIAIIDYGMGNLRSVEKAFHSLGFPATVLGDPDLVRKAEAVVLPGVGAFPKAMHILRRQGLDRAVRDAIDAGKPFLGICLGYQLLFSDSEEFELTEGLNIFKGRVVRFSGPPFERAGDAEPLKVPHMGWNALRLAAPAPVLEGVDDGAMVYFVHSYYPVPEDQRVIATRTEHGIEFASSVVKDNVFACQFHPEKSGAVGLGMLDNFGRAVYGVPPDEDIAREQQAWFQSPPPGPGRPRP